MAKQEAEAMLLGIWPNIETLEASISLPELQAILGAYYEAEYRRNKFTAALKGINLDEQGQNSPKERFEAIKRRIEAAQTGKSESQLELEQDFGLDVEVE